jgi:hypothetical protein
MYKARLTWLYRARHTKDLRSFMYTEPWIQWASCWQGWELCVWSSDSRLGLKGAKEYILSRHNVQLSPVDVMSELHKCWILTTESTVAGLKSSGSAEAVFMLLRGEECTGGTHAHIRSTDPLYDRCSADMQSVYISLHRLWDHRSEICDRQSYIVCSLHK